MSTDAELARGRRGLRPSLLVLFVVGLLLTAGFHFDRRSEPPVATFAAGDFRGVLSLTGAIALEGTLVAIADEGWLGVSPRQRRLRVAALLGSAREVGLERLVLLDDRSRPIAHACGVRVDGFWAGAQTEPGSEP